MRLLFDQNISHRLITQISDIFPEAKQVRHLGIENFSDREIWEYAKRENYAVVTFDGDFYDFSVIWGHPPKVIWIRTFDQTTRHIEVLLRMHQGAILALEHDHEAACLEIIHGR